MPTTTKPTLHAQLPVIDLQGYDKGGERRKAIAEEIRKAATTWGFFQIINHGVPTSTIKGVLEGSRRFFEQAEEEKMRLFSLDFSQSVRYFVNDVRVQEKCFKESFSCKFVDNVIEDPHIIPDVCRYFYIFIEI